MSNYREEESKNLNRSFMLKTVVKYYLWGGNRLNDDFDLNYDINPFAEAWVCSCYPKGDDCSSFNIMSMPEGSEDLKLRRQI